jgi:cytochrome c peroxidase
MISMFTIPGTKIDGGFIHTNNCAIVDLKKRKVINVATLDKSLSGKADPWGIDCSKDGKKLCIVHSGSNELSILDIPQLLSVASDTIQYTPELIVNPWKDTIALRRKFSALNGIHWNAPIAAKGPRTLTISAGKAYVAGYFGNQIEVFSLDSSSATAAGTISLGAPEVLTSERKGEQAFFDGNLCLQKWQTCHSCHAFSRMDGLNYYGNEDSWGPKNTTSILYSWWTPPTTWAGRRANTFESNRAEMKINLFLQPDQEKALTIDTFVQNLKPISSPFLVKGQLSGSAAKGKELFFGNAGCSRCHPAPLFTDLKKYNAGVVDLYDANTQWGTPSLVECWRTAPYGHMGDGLTVREMLDLPGMGAVSGKLTEEEVRQLVEFVLSL